MFTRWLISRRGEFTQGTKVWIGSWALSIIRIHILGGGVIYVYFHPYLGKRSKLTTFFPNGLKPPTSIRIYIFPLKASTSWSPTLQKGHCSGPSRRPSFPAQDAGTINKTVLQFIKEGAGNALWWEDLGFSGFPGRFLERRAIRSWSADCLKLRLREVISTSQFTFLLLISRFKSDFGGCSWNHTQQSPYQMWQFETCWAEGR